MVRGCDDYIGVVFDLFDLWIDGDVVNYEIYFKGCVFDYFF